MPGVAHPAAFARQHRQTVLEVEPLAALEPEEDGGEQKQQQGCGEVENAFGAAAGVSADGKQLVGKEVVLREDAVAADDVVAFGRRYLVVHACGLQACHEADDALQLDVGAAEHHFLHMLDADDFLQAVGVVHILEEQIALRNA